MRIANYHTHTVFSDGENTPRECIDAARKKGLFALGISDHSYTPFDLSYCMRPETCMQYCKTVREEQKRVLECGFQVYLGTEWDAGSDIDREQYDYTIGAVHYILKGEQMYPVDLDLSHQLDCIQNEFHGNKLDYAKYYFEQVTEHARKNRPDVMAHFDLITKFSLFDEQDPAYRKIVMEAMAETVRYVPIFEMNSGAICRGLKTDPYPNPSFLKDLREMGGKILFSSDAHQADNIDFAFPKMISTAKNAGFESMMLFENGQFMEESLE